MNLVIVESPAKAKTINKYLGKEYKVLARKYRPQKFSDLIGQDAMVKILKNSILNNRNT